MDGEKHLTDKRLKKFFNNMILLSPGSERYYEVISKTRNQISHYLSSL